VALGLLGHALHEHAEEAGDVRLAHQQIEGELHGVGLDVRHALGATALIVFGAQGQSKRAGVIAGGQGLDAIRVERRCLIGWGRHGCHSL
jgi:hypothetical protein